MNLTHKERFNRLFKGLPVDRVPFLDYMGNCNFPSCLARWKKEGLKQDADWQDIRDMLGFDYVRGFYIDVKLLFYPEFEVKFVKREGNKTFALNRWGGLELQQDGSELMPITLEGAVKDRYSWDMLKERLQGGISARFPANFGEICKEAAQSDLPVYIGDLPAGFYGGPRELCGFETLSYMFYDDPELICEILDTLCDLWIKIYSEVQKFVPLDYVFIWEDMCGKTGPLISPDIFQEFLLPRYKKLCSALKAGGCTNFAVDSDGDTRHLVPLWLEGGVNIVLPWESQFGLNIPDVREQFPALGILGALNKYTLEFSRDEMDAELQKVPYMLERGYYIPSLDHGVTNKVSWSNYCYFYEKLRGLIYKYPPECLQ